MNDSADMKSAKLALDQSVESLEAGMAQMIARIKTLEASANDHEAFREDRAKLAAQLDETSAEAEAAKEKLAAREAEFEQLTLQSEAELDQIIGVVKGALKRSQGA